MVYSEDEQVSPTSLRVCSDQSSSEGEESHSSQECSDGADDPNSPNNIIPFYFHNHSNSCMMAHHTRGAARREVERCYPIMYCNSGGGFGCQPSLDSDDEEDSFDSPNDQPLLKEI
jgi:hypothetical protein